MVQSRERQRAKKEAVGSSEVFSTALGSNMVDMRTLMQIAVKKGMMTPHATASDWAAGHPYPDLTRTSFSPSTSLPDVGKIENKHSREARD